MIFSAVGELTLNKTVIHCMNLIQMPVYLLYLPVELLLCLTTFYLWKKQAKN